MCCAQEVVLVAQNALLPITGFQVTTAARCGVRMEQSSRIQQKEESARHVHILVQPVLEQ